MKQRSQGMAWCNLPSELVIKISDHNESCIDKLRLQCVCSPWRAALRHQTNHHRPFVHVIPANNNVDFFGTTSDPISDIFLIKRTIFLVSPLPNSISALNNSDNLYPFIFKIEKVHSNDKFRCLHPFLLYPNNYYSKFSPQVMNLSDFRITALEDEYVLCYESVDQYHMLRRYYYNKKVVHLHLGNGDGYAVLTIQRSADELAMFRSADRQWQLIGYMGLRFCDIISFNGDFYAVDYYGETVAVSVDSGDVVPVAAKLEGEEHRDKKYLVQLGNELILVVRRDNEAADMHMDYDEYLFDVYKLDSNDSKWVKVNSLGDRVLFLGDASTFSASALDLNLLENMGTHICHMDDLISFIRQDYKDIGRHVLRAYDMKADTAWDHLNYYLSKLFWPVPSWITYSVEQGNRIGKYMSLLLANSLHIRNKK